MDSDKTSIFDHVEATQWDPIVEILEEYRACTDTKKINLTIGAYRDEELNPVVFNCVRKAEDKIFSEKFSRAYLPPTGDEEFNLITQTTIFPEGHDIYKQNRMVTVQSISGSGCLRLGGEFIKRLIANTIYVPHLTWPNHFPIFQMSNLKVITYGYYDSETNGLNINSFLEDLKNAEENAVVLLHVCGNNPTGVDPSRDEWKQIGEVMKKKNLFPFFDMAYQGFISGDIYEDSYPIQLFNDMGFEMIIAQSFSKSMGLYGERAGPLHIIVNDPSSLPNVKSQLNDLALGMYICPVGHGSRIIKTVLSDENLRKEWIQELNIAVTRLNSVRYKLYEHLTNLNTPIKWDHIKNQHGMFTYTGLTKEQCETLIKKYKIFLVKSGRISLAGLNEENVHRVAEAIKDVVENY